MNAPSLPQAPGPVTPNTDDDDDSINLLGLLDVVLDQRWLIAGTTAVALVMGTAYAVLSTPVYEANTLIQVEDSKGGGMAALLGDAAGMFSSTSPTNAEIEILRSRLVVGQAVEALQLDTTVTPKYVPVVGKWLARRATTPSQPGFLGMAGYVNGNEDLTIRKLEVPPELMGEPLTVQLTPQGYTLRQENTVLVTQGEVGKPSPFTFMGQPGVIQVSAYTGLPGAEFTVVKASTLKVMSDLQQSLKINEQGRNSGVIRVSLEDTEPARAAGILQQIGQVYVKQNTERKAAEAEKSIFFLNSQLPQLRKELEAAETRLNQFRRQQGTFDLSSEAGALLTESSGMRVKLVELQQKRKELETRYTAQHPTVMAVDSQIRAIQADLQGKEGQAKSLPSLEQDLLRLTRDVKVNSELYTSLLNSFQQLRLVKEGKVGNVRIVDVAVTPEQAVKPKRALLLALSGVLGAVLGLGLAFVRNSLRAGISDANDLEQHLGLHVYATVPQSKAQDGLAQAALSKRPGQHLLALTYPEDPAVESLRSLRTALQFAMLEARNRIVLLTGPTPGIGKSFTSANLATVLAAAGKRVLLVDADMRKGHIHQYLGLERGAGLSDLIAGTRTLSDVVHAQVAPGLDFVSTGNVAPNPAELMLSPAVGKLLQQMEAQYDIVLIDTPPVLAVADTSAVASQAGTVFVVARADVSTLGEVQETSKRLRQAGSTVNGVIFNGLNISKRRYGYAYGYGYKYSRYRYKAYAYGNTST
ncbi:polysaccharide biosynthesis tyrosine autokinase [Diaphorobacter sp. JS3051]|uniref:polysaccharide biosynthesis tyrosine autokinase n=1 Tax=Diaphorobacter sp. JS3051 TaxID=2792224 RepID=UPI0018CB60DD|nr:polysaccharide biosynthesis tyrosine autokinase [Diaphorobacter sp. JS3051]QPN33202.1 polysaccharide biosynthesis tyrosine autokinase [Diaphorobacter sp. JS3051]